MLVVQPGDPAAAGDADGAWLAGFSGLNGLEKQGALVAHLDHIDMQADQGAPVDSAGVAADHDHVRGLHHPLRRLSDVDENCGRRDATAADTGEGFGHQFTAPAQTSAVAGATDSAPSQRRWFR